MAALSDRIDSFTEKFEALHSSTIESIITGITQNSPFVTMTIFFSKFEKLESMLHLAITKIDSASSAPASPPRKKRVTPSKPALLNNTLEDMEDDDDPGTKAQLE